MLDFKLDDTFVQKYAETEPFWGFTDAGGNSFGELVFIRTYARPKEDGTKERWWEVCRRVVEGMYHEQKRWCLDHRIPWSPEEAQRSAQEAYDLMFRRCWAPPGRGMQMMGTKFVHETRNSTPLQNCAFRATGDITIANPAAPFMWIMEQSMLGVGVGFDTLGADARLRIHAPDPARTWTFIVPDTREGWCEALQHKMESYLKPDRGVVQYDVSEVRPAGAPIKTFGGTAAGPEPLVQMLAILDELFGEKIGQTFDTELLVDVANLVGKCVVSGNVRRSALIAIGPHDDKIFADLKDWEKYPRRNNIQNGWGWTSNNSLFAEVGMDYSGIAERIRNNGEPGLVWMDVTRRYGRLIDPENTHDARAQGYNPCGEQSLESNEMCTLSNLYPVNCTDLDEFKRAIKYAYLYAKTVTLIPTHLPETNAIMQRNRRIGTSFNGAWQFVEQHSWGEFDRWMDEGYQEVVRRDRQYSEWLCVRESNRHTTVKPDGTGSQLAGATPGAHAMPGGEYYIRRMRYGKDDPAIPLLREAGYVIEPALGNMDTTVVVEFPIQGMTGVRPEDEVSAYEKAAVAARMQRLWSDNSVSYTLTFDPERETDAPENILRMFEGQLKSISFLPMASGTYAQAPYEKITREQYESYRRQLKKVDFTHLYGIPAEIELQKFCTTDVCEVNFG